MSQTPTIGRIVHYKLSGQDADAINSRRQATLAARQGFVPRNCGGQNHTGNQVRAGDVYPLIITRVWDHGLPDSTTMLVNGQVLLDGNDVYWATSVREGGGESQYQWPQR